MSRILIIDDNEAIHGDFRKILAATGESEALSQAASALFGDQPKAAAPRAQHFEIASAMQGQEGLQRVQEALAAQNPFSVAFVDMRMPPGWDGLETIENLWKVDPALEVVICSAYSDRSWDEIMATLGRTDKLLILKKPFDPVEVLQLASALSEKWRLRKQATLKLEELEKLVEQRTSALSHLALHDKLTGLPNRAQIKDRLSKAIERTKERGGSYAVFFLDFDRFKIVNDSLGHDAGDQLLMQIAERLTACADAETQAGCEEMVAARLGGDEFVILARSGAADPGAVRIGESLLRRLKEPYFVKGYNLTSSASIGITTSDHAYESPDDVIRDADTAMYHAKASGKARYVIFDQRMHAELKQRLEFETELAGVTERGEFALHYQPIVCLATGQLRGFEALARWNHPTRGLIPPDKFIHVAEETGSIIPIGNWVLHEACRQLNAWKAQFPTRRGLVVSVNVSAKQLASPSIVRQVEQAIRENNVERGQLVIEVTESAIIEDPTLSSEILNQIKQLGVGISMDDFGTGYTSLSHLHRLPLSCLKIDRSFMKSVSERRDYAAVVHAIVNLAQNLNITVVAEGVETSDQLVMLQSIGCDWAQGYLFGRPVDAATAAEFITRPTLAKAA
ncbi:MAG TPA: EAL domain-containing protein [Phycisphaerales bacterium]|nr:EAL domain-containing protein [Phycisphaerales bacterium]